MKSTWITLEEIKQIDSAKALYAEYKSTVVSWFKEQIKQKSCVNNMKFKSMQKPEHDGMPGFINIKECSDAELSFINFSLNGHKLGDKRNGCKSIYSSALITFFMSHYDPLYVLYKLEFFRRVFEEKENFQHFKTQLKARLLELVN